MFVHHCYFVRDFPLAPRFRLADSLHSSVFVVSCAGLLWWQPNTWLQHFTRTSLMQTLILRWRICSVNFPSCAKLRLAMCFKQTHPGVNTPIHFICAIKNVHYKFGNTAKKICREALKHATAFSVRNAGNLNYFNEQTLESCVSHNHKHWPVWFFKCDSPLISWTMILYLPLKQSRFSTRPEQ